MQSLQKRAVLLLFKINLIVHTRFIAAYRHGVP
jgi:hypothetical protein